MDQEKFGKLIKEIRKKNNLTQNDLANKYNVTYQAVSKWENGKNMPDMALIKQISNDFNISLEEMLDVPKKNKKPLLLIILTSLIIILIIVIIILNSSSFKFKTISSNCNNFNISGTIAYNKNKTAIHITNIEYCETTDITEYKEIKCTLYEKNKNTLKEISICKTGNNIKLEDYLKEIDIEVPSYSKTCKEYTNNSLYLEINATDKNEKITTYKIPLKLNDTCTN